MPINWPPLKISPHPKAPLFSQESNPSLVLKHAMDEITSQGGFQTIEEVRQLLRQAGYVSLWFYLKFICGFAGPYDKLNGELHVEMCNFRQKAATTPGIKAAMFLPRASLKSTIASHGANGWELIRNPNLRIGCISETADRAQSFVLTTINTFEKNELHRWLYPEHTKANRDSDSLILSSRTKYTVDPNLKWITAGGSTQGIHLDVFNPDDIVGETMLNADHVSGADMIRMGNWLHSNLHTLVVNWYESRIVLVGTRYSVDDPYEPIMLQTKEQYGDWTDLDYPIDRAGEWTTYYRSALTTEGESIYPDQYNEEGLRKMRDGNPWLFWTQYQNKPYAAKPGDFGQYRIHDIEMVWDDTFESYKILFPDGSVRYLTTADVVAAGDPAASSKSAGIHTSKSATTVIARWSDDTIVILEADKGYVEPTKFFDWLTDYNTKYGIILRATYSEAQAGFKSFIPISRQIQHLRGKTLNLLAVPALGDKETTIKNILQPFLERGKLYTRKEIGDKVREEIRVFPSRSMDLLDAIKIAIFKSHRPDSAYDDLTDEDEDDHRPKRRLGVDPLTGY